MKPAEKLRAWLVNNRASSRIAFGMRIATLGIGTVLSLFWQWAFVNLMGKHVYGVLLSFQQVTQFAGVGDFGVCGAIGLRTGQMLGRGEQDRLHSFLASARTLFLCISLLISCGFAILSPWLPGWLGFVETPGAGPLLLLFAAGTFVVLNNFINGYFASINNGCGTVMWPIVPVFLISQLSQLGQWLAARWGADLWVLVLVQALSLLVQAVLGWWMIRVSFRQLARLLPMGYDLALWKELVSTSGWVCLYLLGYIIYRTTGNLLVNAGFGSGMVPAAQLQFQTDRHGHAGHHFGELCQPGQDQHLVRRSGPGIPGPCADRHPPAGPVPVPGRHRLRLVLSGAGQQIHRAVAGTGFSDVHGIAMGLCPESGGHRCRGIPTSRWPEFWDGRVCERQALPSGRLGC